MTFGEWCETAVNTEEEERFFEFMQRDDMQELEDVFLRLQRLPFLGKTFAAMNALDAYETLAEYMESEHYQHIKNWDFKFDADTETFSFQPGPAQRQKCKKVFITIAAVVGVIILCRKFCCRNTK